MCVVNQILRILNFSKKVNENLVLKKINGVTLLCLLNKKNGRY